jgi:hypothetical protein
MILGFIRNDAGKLIGFLDEVAASDPPTDLQRVLFGSRAKWALES